MNDEIIKALVRPLAWQVRNKSCHKAGNYYIEPLCDEENIFVLHLVHSIRTTHHPTLAAAKAAAEADYRAHILAALDLTAVERLVEAAEAYKRERLKLDDTPEFCAMVAALAAFKGATK